MDLSQEELSKMSPEELRDYQKKNCIFCHIIAGRVQSKKIFEDDQLLGIMDINPANPGHLLLIPKEHYMVLPQMPDPEIGHLFMASKGISHAMLKALKAGGTNIFIANGAMAGQKSPHFMAHIIPRMDNDGVKAFDIPRGQPKDLPKLRKALSAAVSRALGGQPTNGTEATGASAQVGITEDIVNSRPTLMTSAVPSPDQKAEIIVDAEPPAPKKRRTGKAKKTIEKQNPDKTDDVSLDDIARLIG